MASPLAKQASGPAAHDLEFADAQGAQREEQDDAPQHGDGGEFGGGAHRRQRLREGVGEGEVNQAQDGHPGAGGGAGGARRR